MAGTNNALNNSSTVFQVDNLNLDGNTISTTNSNGDLVLAPNGSGVVSVTAAPVVPSTDRADSLGSATNSWDNVYADGVSFDDGSNILGFYASGNFTPTLTGGSVAGVTTYTAQVGAYVKVGNMVTINVAIGISAATGTGSVTIGGIPYAPYANTAGTSGLYLDAAGFTFPAGRTSPSVYWNGTNCTIQCTGSGVGVSALQMTNAAMTLIFSMSFASF